MANDKLNAEMVARIRSMPRGKYAVPAVAGGAVGAVVAGVVFGGVSSVALGALAGVATGILVVKVAVMVAEMTDEEDTRLEDLDKVLKNNGMEA